MGKENNVIINYLSDKKRFADLINAEIYDGRQVIDPGKLEEISANTYIAVGRKDEKKIPVRRERRGDLAMRYEDGSIYRIFLTEAQNKVLYTLPIRNMSYMTAAYLKQYEQLYREHERAQDYASEVERQSGLNKTDRLRPVYMLWVYHGEEPWDGPRRLKDMVDFGDDRDSFSHIFRDSVPHLLCINEMKDAGKYTTDLRELMDLLRRQSDKKALKELVEKEKRFHILQPDTYEAAAVLLNMPSLWKRRRKYADEEGRFDMCKAFRDWEAEIREEQDEVIKKKDAQLEQKDAKITDLENENAKLRAKLAANGVSLDD